MKERIILFILLLFYCNMELRAQQQISLDAEGRLYDLKLTRPDDQINVSIVNELDAKALQDRIRSFFLEKISITLFNLDDPNQLYKKYYERLWSATKLNAIGTELKAIKKWLEDDTDPGSITYLSDFYKGLQVLRKVNATDDWYTVNNNKLPDSVLLKKSEGDKSIGAFLIELRKTSHFNRFTTDLYKATYEPAANSGINGLSVTDYLREEIELKRLLTRIEVILKMDLNAMKQSDSLEIVAIGAAVKANRIIVALRSSSTYFTNWIWLRTGEFVINPFEKKAKDILTGTPGNLPLPRSRNVSLLQEATVKDEFLNRILLSHHVKRDYRNIHYFRLAGSSIKQNKTSIDEPLRGDERVKVNMHNTLANETLELLLTDTVRHNGLNETLNNINTGIGILANAYGSFSSVAGFIGTTLGSLTPKSIGNLSAYRRSRDMSDTVTEVKKVQDSLKADLKDAGEFNPYLFELATVDATVTAFLEHGRIRQNERRAYVNILLDVYRAWYDQYDLIQKSVKPDSMLVAFTYNNIYESSLPPATVKLSDKGSNKPVYRTEILETEKLNDDLKAKYLVRSFVAKGAKTDTVKLATFSTKNAKLKWMVASAGLMLTIPERAYAVNTFTGGESAAVITTKRKTTSFVVGLNIYVKPINMLDNHWFHHENSPWYSRASFFIGLDVPDIMYHFYPGISYDMLPGFKITSGMHIYRHTKFEIRNNVVQKQGDVLRSAGPFIGLNIDPAVIVKLLNLFNNK